MENTQNKSQNLIKGAFSLTLSSLIVKALGLIYKIPLSYILSDEGMGYFNSAYTVYTFFFIVCSAGIPKAISILTSRAEEKGDINKVEKIYKVSFVFFFVFGLIITGCFVATSKYISVLIGNRNSYLSMLTIAPSIIFICASSVIRGYFNGRLKFIPIAISEAISGVSRLLLGLLLALFGYKMNYSLSVISSLTILGTALGAFLGYIYLAIYKKTHEYGIKSKQKFDLSGSKQIISEILKLAVPITLTSAVGSFGGIIDLAIIMERLNNSGYTELQASIIYGNYTTLAVPMLNLVSSLIAPISMVLLPIISKDNTKCDKLLISERISVIFKIVLFFAIPIFVFLLFRPSEVLSILFEDSSANMAAPLLAALAPGILFMCLLSVINTTLEAMGRTTVPLISLLCGNIVKFVISYIVIGSSNFGIIGAPIGTSISYFVSLIISISYLISLRKIRIDFALPLFITSSISVLSITACSIIRRIISVENVLIYIAEAIIFSLIYLISIYKFNFFNLKTAKKLAKYTKKQ